MLLESESDDAAGRRVSAAGLEDFDRFRITGIPEIHLRQKKISHVLLTSYVFVNTRVCEKYNPLEMKTCRNVSFQTPNQRLGSRFCCQIVGKAPAQKELLFHRHRTPVA